MLNGAEAALPAYSISGNNYVKLRDVGALFGSRFDVRWEDGKAKRYNMRHTPRQAVSLPQSAKTG
jgi:hypothetical protein